MQSTVQTLDGGGGEGAAVGLTPEMTMAVSAFGLFVPILMGNRTLWEKYNLTRTPSSLPHKRGAFLKV